MADDWYYQTGGQTFGPMSAESLKAGAKSGRLSREGLIRRGREGKWVAATKVKGLFRECAEDTDDPAIVIRPLSPGAPGLRFVRSRITRWPRSEKLSDRRPHYQRTSARAWSLTLPAITVAAGPDSFFRTRARLVAASRATLFLQCHRGRQAFLRRTRENKRRPSSFRADNRGDHRGHTACGVRPFRRLD